MSIWRQAGVRLGKANLSELVLLPLTAAAKDKARDMHYMHVSTGLVCALLGFLRKQAGACSLFIMAVLHRVVVTHIVHAMPLCFRGTVLQEPLPLDRLFPRPPPRMENPFPGHTVVSDGVRPAGAAPGAGRPTATTAQAQGALRRRHPTHRAALPALPC